VPTLGPDGTGVGHVFWYHLETNGMDWGTTSFARLVRKFALQTVPEWLKLLFEVSKSNTNWF
jgi:Cu(I)/Ag(I) efflux system membrane protein CusA/SilA